MKKTYVYGASGHGKVLMSCLLQKGFSPSGFIDDNKMGTQFYGLCVFNPNEIDFSLSEILLGIGDNKVRGKIVEQKKIKSFKLISDISCVSIAKSDIGEGTVILDLAVVQVGSKIGKHCIINNNATIDHDCIVGDYVHVAPGATICGNVSIGSFSWVGAGSTVIQGIKIGSNSLIGAGSVVLKDVPDNVVLVGNPARILKKNV